MIAVYVRHVPQKTLPTSTVVFHRLGGAYADVPDDATAFGGSRRPGYATFTMAIGAAPEPLEADRRWVRDLTDELRPHARPGHYLNGLADADRATMETGYGAKWDRLRRIKAQYDPQNVFHRNFNIPPAV